MQFTRIFLCLMSLCATTAVAEKVWRWVDAEGVVHYADQPGPADSEQVELTAQTYKAFVPTQRKHSRQPAATQNYFVEIWKPAPETTFTNSGGQVSVGIRVEPELAPGYLLSLYLDGQRVNSATPDSTEYDLRDLDRGQHYLNAVITDYAGNQIQTSTPVVFYVQRPSVIRQKK